MPRQTLQSGSGTRCPRSSVSAKKLQTFNGKLTCVVRLLQKLRKAFPRSLLFYRCKSDHRGVGAHDLLDTLIHTISPPNKLKRSYGTKVPGEDLRGGCHGRSVMDRVTRCLLCGKRMVPAPGLTGRTELMCVYCDKLDPMEMEHAKKWAESPLAPPISERAH